MSRLLLIDADILAYQSAAKNQRKYDWGGGVTSTAADFEPAKQAAEEAIMGLVKSLKADEVCIVLSDDFRSFRKELVDPTYKQLRNATERPEYLYDMKDWLRDTYETAERPLLEADDVMGIMATEPHDGERIIVSADKDMMTIPGLLYRPNKNITGRVDAEGKTIKPQGILKIAPMEAIRFHFYQTLVGDPTDGYSGAPNIGPSSLWVEGVMEAETEAEAWDYVLAGYGSRGLTEEDAVRQARLARILQHTDYVDGRVRLWLPPFEEELEGAN